MVDLPPKLGQIPKNQSTPRIFIAATRMNEGKTTVSLSLIAALRDRRPRMGFIKPVGQRFIEVDGHKIDEDSVLLKHVLGGGDPIAEMSPVAVEPQFTRKYLQTGNHDALVTSVVKAFDRIAWEKDFMVIEGTGHAGVGSVFDLSNATVAKLLHAKALLVTQGGIGRPIDEVALNKALFDQMGVPLIGVILNKVEPAKMEQVREFATKGLRRLGVDLLGVVPRLTMLENPTLGQISERLGAVFLQREDARHVRAERIVIGAMTPNHARAHFQPGSLIITPGDREDLILAALDFLLLSPERKGPAGLVLSDNIPPSGPVVEAIRRTKLPVMTAPHDSYTVASLIHNLTVKTRASDLDKVEAIRAQIPRHLDVERILKAVT